MKNVVKTITAGAVMGGSLLFTAGLGIANAQPNTAGDGQVNVAIGDIGVLEDVELAAAAQIAAGVCASEVDSVTEVIETVDTEGAEQTVCTNNLGTVKVQQNGPGQSENAPGQAGTTPGNSGSTPTSPASPTETPEAPSGDQGS